MVSAKVLITGATGGLGQILARMAHHAGYAVTATGRNQAIGAQLQAEGIPFLTADLVQGDLSPLVDGMDSIIHLAALSRPWGPLPAFEAANVVATNRLMHAAKAAGVRRFMYASTPSIYAQPCDQWAITEHTRLPARFANPYAETKWAAERLVLSAAEPDFTTVALRPRAIIGPHDTVLLPRLLRAAGKGVLPLPRGGRAVIEPTDARDAAAAFLVAEREADRISGRAFNISGGQPVAVRALASHVFDRLERRVRIVPVPAWLAMRAAGAAEAVARYRKEQPEPTITSYSVMTVGWSQTFDLSAARDDLGWSPRYSPFDAVDWALEGMHHAAG